MGYGKRAGKHRKFANAILQLSNLPSNRDRCETVRHSNDRFIKDFCSEIKRLKFRKLTKHQLQTVKRYKPKLKQLISPRISIKQKRKTLTQKGGFIGAILGSLVLPNIVKAVLG